MSLLRLVCFVSLPLVLNCVGEDGVVICYDNFRKSFKTPPTEPPVKLRIKPTVKPQSKSWIKPLIRLHAKWRPPEPSIPPEDRHVWCPWSSWTKNDDVDCGEASRRTRKRISRCLPGMGKPDPSIPIDELLNIDFDYDKSADYTPCGFYSIAGAVCTFGFGSGLLLLVLASLHFYRRRRRNKMVVQRMEGEAANEPSPPLRCYCEADPPTDPLCQVMADSMQTTEQTGFDSCCESCSSTPGASVWSISESAQVVELPEFTSRQQRQCIAHPDPPQSPLHRAGSLSASPPHQLRVACPCPPGTPLEDAQSPLLDPQRHQAPAPPLRQSSLPPPTRGGLSFLLRYSHLQRSLDEPPNYSTCCREPSPPHYEEALKLLS